jgi:hypothetical protein
MIKVNPSKHYTGIEILIAEYKNRNCSMIDLSDDEIG